MSGGNNSSSIEEEDQGEHPPSSNKRTNYMFDRPQLLSPRRLPTQQYPREQRNTSIHKLAPRLIPDREVYGAAGMRTQPNLKPRSQ